MVDYSRWDSFDSGDSGDEVTTHDASTSTLTLPSRTDMATARAYEKKARSMTSRIEQQFDDWEKDLVQVGQKIEANIAMMTSARKDMKATEKTVRRLAARQDAMHQKARRNLLFASEADVEERHEVLKETEKIRSQIVKVEAKRRSAATDIEAASARLLNVRVDDHSKLGTMLAVNRQYFGQQCQQAKKEATRILRGQLLDNRNRVSTAPNLAQLRDLCRSGKAHVTLLATCEQTDTVIAGTDTIVCKVEDMCHEVFLGCIECGAGAMAVRPLAVCARCKLVHYCCRAHQLSGWSAHKAACKQQGAERAFGVLEHLIDAAERREASA